MINEDYLMCPSPTSETVLPWLERTLPRIIRRLMDHNDPETPLMDLPVAQLRLVHALHDESHDSHILVTGETMGRLSERLGVRQNALTQAADRLIGHGLAERLGDSSDRRVVRLRLTEQGQRLVGERRAKRIAHLGELWSGLDTTEREEFLRAVNVLALAGARMESNRTDATMRRLEIII